MIFSSRALLSFVLLVLIFLSACAPSGVEVVSETDEKQYRLAQDYLDQGRVDEALSAFHRVIDARRDAPESHFEAGLIYLQNLNDPIRAIYHFDRYLQMKPQSEQAPRVRQLIESGQKEFARQLPAKPYSGDLDRIDLMDLVKNLKIENQSLKRDLLTVEKRNRALQASLSSGGGGQVRSTSSLMTPPELSARGQSQSSSRAVTGDPASVPRLYKVRSGDSLSSISKKFYGTPSRWNDIYQANRDRLSSENALKVGAEIRIP